MTLHIDDSSISVVAHPSSSFIDGIRHDINDIFDQDMQHYMTMNIGEYRNLVSHAQQQLNNRNITHNIVDQIYDDIIAYIGEDEFYVQTNLYLRAARPTNETLDHEAIGWHRESWYGTEILASSVNIWTPILGVNANSTLQYIPQSQHILDDDITIEQQDDDITKKHSAGHKIGFLYAPKKIIGGVDLSTATPMVVPIYHSALFSAHLIHGAGYNHSDTIRFSLDFRILPASAYCANDAKQYHFASNKPYFEKFLR